MKKLGMFVGFLSFSFGVMADVTVDPEQLLGVSVDERGITFQVESNGCTYKRDFDFHVEEIWEPLGPMLPAEALHHYITVNRTRPDRCEAYVPYGTQIFMSFEDLGIHYGEFHVKNPIGGFKLVTAP